MADANDVSRKRSVSPLKSPLTPDEFFLISASKDSSPILRNGEIGDWIGTFEGHKGTVWSCCLNTNALRAASAFADFTTKIWDALSEDELHSFEHKHIVRACAISEDTNILLTGAIEKILRVFDLNRPDAPPKEVDNSPCSIRTVAWLHSDRTIFSSSTNTGGVRLWDVRSGKNVHTLKTKSCVTSAEVSHDGHYITTADGSTVKFGLVKSFNMPCTVESASQEPKLGNKFIAAGEDMWIRLFDFHTGEEIGCNKGHHGLVHCERFSPRGESYASGSEDGTIRIWQTGPATHDENETSPANESTRKEKEKVSVDEVSRKIGGFHIPKGTSSEAKELARRLGYGSKGWKPRNGHGGWGIAPKAKKCVRRLGYRPGAKGMGPEARVWTQRLGYGPKGQGMGPRAKVWTRRSRNGPRGYGIGPEVKVELGAHRGGQLLGRPGGAGAGEILRKDVRCCGWFKHARKLMRSFGELQQLEMVLRGLVLQSWLPCKKTRMKVLLLGIEKDMGSLLVCEQWDRDIWC
ncbi:hypothetical protein HHK36_032776 [Tetracentron sinense]|uniref:Serine-threonine kinase receptor-associated protein n=1 Tax=Tetracentron sinense TaxID=13715 RepID=A0A834Y6U9_TETSI|nr:hypothetical protein HHK36_032776 [Tetracentron sinense]